MEKLLKSISCRHRNVFPYYHYYFFLFYRNVFSVLSLLLFFFINNRLLASGVFDHMFSVDIMSATWTVLTIVWDVCQRSTTKQFMYFGETSMTTCLFGSHTQRRNNSFFSNEVMGWRRQIVKICPDFKQTANGCLIWWQSFSWSVFQQSELE